MQARTAAFDAAIRSGYTAASRIDVLHGGAVVASLDAATSGTVTVERTAAVRRRCSIIFADQTGALTPTSANALLAPYGAELVIYRGVAYPDGTVEQVPLGTFRVDDVNTTVANGDVTVAVEGFDRSAGIAENRFVDPYVVPAGTNYGDAIAALILRTYPAATLLFAPTGHTTPLIVVDGGANSGPWATAVSWATAIGMELLPDTLGRWVLRPQPDPSTDQSVWDYSEGDNATILTAARRLKRTGTYNGVVATGEATSNTQPFHGEAWDLNPASPTYRYGPFGEVPMFFLSPLMTSDRQCADAALSLLVGSLGLSEEIRFDAMPHPAHEAGDVVIVSSVQAGIDHRVAVLDSFTIGLGADTMMPCVARARQVTLT